MERSRHPDKHIERAIQYAESLGWRVAKSSARAHSWGKLRCPHRDRDGCTVYVWCTPRNPENHANQITRDVDQCPHEHNARDDERAAGDAQPPCEAEHDFALLLGGISEIDEQAADALFEAGCDDCTISVRSGRVSLSFVRMATSLTEAINSAIRNVRSAGIRATIVRIDKCNLVTQSEIARKIGRTRQQVHQYVNGDRGSGVFRRQYFGLLRRRRCGDGAKWRIGCGRTAF